jgi:hypothetical protein
MKTKEEIKTRLGGYITRQKVLSNPNTLQDNSPSFASYAILDAQLRILISELEWVLKDDI